MTTNGIAQKIWNFCHTLRDDGVGYGDYLEQITYLLFLKMAHEYSQPPYNRDTKIPEEYNWESLVEKSGSELEQHYVTLLRELGKESGMLGQIFVKAKNKIQDPAAGTARFFLAAYDFLLENNELDKDQKEFLKYHTFKGWEIVPNTARMALMNLFLHNIGDINSEPPIVRNDSLIAEPSEKFDYVLANPPFGKKSSITVTNEDGSQSKEALTYNRQDFWATSSNKQLNFVQHINAMLKAHGEAAVVLPDNVLFEGGAGETVRKKLLQNADVHTVLRLPTGIFYAQGVKANVVFFDAKPASKDPWSKEVWYYDYRTNIHHTLKKQPLAFDDLKEFVELYNPANRHNRKETWSEENPDGRWRKYSYEEITNRDKTSMDIFWIKDDSLTDLDNLPDADILAAEIVENIEAGLESFREIVNGLE